MKHTQMGKKQNFETADEIASKSLTVVRNKNNILPLDPDLNEEIYVIDLMMALIIIQRAV